MTLTQFGTEVKLLLNNMPSSDPFDTAGLITRNINRAANRLVRMAIGSAGENADLFPELRNFWEVGPTEVGGSTGGQYQLRPSDAIMVTDVVSSDSSSAPTWGDTQERTLGKAVSAQTIGLMPKGSTIADYPRIWARRAKKILYWPTTRTGYTTYLGFYGVARLTPLSSGSETFQLEEDWDHVIVRLAASLTAHDMGWKEEGDNWLAAVKDQILETANVTALGMDDGAVEADGIPMRSDIYGGE